MGVIKVFFQLLRRRHLGNKIARAMASLSKNGESALFVSLGEDDGLVNAFITLAGDIAPENYEEESFLKVRNLLNTLVDKVTEGSDLNLEMKLTRKKKR